MCSVLSFLASSKSPKPQKPKGKENRVWVLGGSSTKELDYSDRQSNGNDRNDVHEVDLVRAFFKIRQVIVKWRNWTFGSAVNDY